MVATILWNTMWPLKNKADVNKVLIQEKKKNLRYNGQKKKGDL